MLYTELRGQVFWFRRRAPEPLKPGMLIYLGDQETAVGKNGYIRFSLKTSDKREAARHARKFAYLVDETAERLRKQLTRPASTSTATDSGQPTREEIQYAAESMYAMLLSADEATMERGLQELSQGSSSEEIREPDRYVWSSADLPPLSLAGQMTLLKKLAPVISFHLHIATGKAVDQLSPDLLPFADAFRRYINALEKRKASEYVPTPALPEVKPSWSWLEAFDYYFKQNPGLAKSTRANYHMAWRTLEASAKCRVDQLTHTHVVAWRDGMLKKLSPRTVKSRLTFAGVLWRESSLNGKIDRDAPSPFQGLRVRLSDNVEGARKEFSGTELKMLFAAPPIHTLRAISIQAGYWLPLLALYHGARLEELTGLEVGDIEDSEQGLLVCIRENTIRPRLKNRRKSQRSVPLHPKLEALGFRDYVEAARRAGVQALFPSFSRGATFGEEYVTHVQNLLAPKPGRLVGMHCFRHNWETAKRTARLDKSAANYITGRPLEEDSAAYYGSAAGLKTLKEEIARIDYGLTHQPAPTVTVAELKLQESRCQRARHRSPAARAAIKATKTGKSA